MRALVLCLLIMSLAGCQPQQRIMEPAATVAVERSDSLRVTYREMVRIDTMMMMMAVPEQSAMLISADSSHLETDFASSDAWVSSDGLLHHILKNKAQRRPIEVPVPTRAISTDSVRERRIEVPVPYPVRVEVERDFSAWERIRLKGFVPAVVVALLCLGFIFKRIVRR